MLCKDTHFLVIFHTVWEHLEVEFESDLPHVLKNFVKFPFSMVSFTSNPSQVVDRCLWGFLDKDLRPEILHKWVVEELITHHLIILFEDIDEYVSLKTIELVCGRCVKFRDYARK